MGFQETETTSRLKQDNNWEGRSVLHCFSDFDNEECSEECLDGGPSGGGRAVGAWSREARPHLPSPAATSHLREETGKDKKTDASKPVRVSDEVVKTSDRES